MLHRGQRGRLDHVDHHRRGQHGDASRTDPRRRVLRRHDEVGAAGQAGADVGKVNRHAVPQSTLKSLGFQSGFGYLGFIVSRVPRTIAAMAALRAHLRSAGMTCHGAQAVEHLLSITS